MISDGKFRKKEHILKSKDFMAVYRKGRSFKRSGVVMCCAPTALGHNRLGFSISSSVIKLASLRNRLRRVFREIYRKRRATMKSAFDIVFIVRRNPGKNISYEWAESVYTALVKEAGILA